MAKRTLTPLEELEVKKAKDAFTEQFKTYTESVRGFLRAQLPNGRKFVADNCVDRFIADVVKELLDDEGSYSDFTYQVLEETGRKLSALINPPTDTCDPGPTPVPVRKINRGAPGELIAGEDIKFGDLVMLGKDGNLYKAR